MVLFYPTVWLVQITRATLSLAAQCDTVVLIGHCDFHLSFVVLIAEMYYTEA